jgi:hypothetical protein
MDFPQLGVSQKIHNCVFLNKNFKKKLGYSEPKQLAFPPQTAQQLTCHKASWRSPERR